MKSLKSPGIRDDSSKLLNAHLTLSSWKFQVKRVNPESFNAGNLKADSLKWHSRSWKRIRSSFLNWFICLTDSVVYSQDSWVKNATPADRLMVIVDRLPLRVSLWDSLSIIVSISINGCNLQLSVIPKSVLPTQYVESTFLINLPAHHKTLMIPEIKQTFFCLENRL